MEQLSVKELKDLADQKTRRETRRYIDAVCKYFGVTEFELKQRSRSPRFAYPRQLLIHLLYEKRLKKINWISAFFGLDHSTCSQAVLKIRRTEEAAADLASIDRVANGERLRWKPKEREVTTQPVAIKRPPAIYSNTTPYGIAKH